MAWIYLLFAGLLEIVWAVSMKQSEGFTRLTPTVITIVGMIASFWLLAVAMRSLPLGTAYTIWTGIGAAGTAIIGIAFYNEGGGPLQLALLAILIAAIVGLKLVSPQ